MNRRFLTGTGVAIVTPFHEDKTVDLESLGKLTRYLVDNKVDYIVVLGTTGESVVLSKEEKKQVVHKVISAAEGKADIVVGIGGNNTEDVLKNIREFDYEGVHAILSVCPYYNKPNQRGLYEHFKAIALESKVPVIVYNVPGRTGTNLAADTTVRLAHDIKNIVAVKEASGNMEQIMQIIRDKPSDFLVISGDDLLTLPIIACGGAGVISVSANAFPRQVVSMVQHALVGNFREALPYHYQLMEVTRLLFSEGSPAGIKAVLHHLGLVKNELRLPLVPVTEATYQKLASAADAILK